MILGKRYYMHFRLFIIAHFGKMKKLDVFLHKNPETVSEEIQKKLSFLISDYSIFRNSKFEKGGKKFSS